MVTDNAGLGRALTNHIRVLSRQANELDKRLDINQNLNAEANLESIIATVNRIADQSAQIRVMAHDAQAKDQYARENLQEARKLLDEIRGGLKGAGEEVDHMTDFRDVLRRYPMAATVLMIFLVEDYSRIHRAIGLLSGEERAVLGRALEEVDHEQGAKK